MASNQVLSILLAFAVLYALMVRIYLAQRIPKCTTCGKEINSIEIACINLYLLFVFFVSENSVNLDNRIEKRVLPSQTIYFPSIQYNSGEIIA